MPSGAPGLGGCPEGAGPWGLPTARRSCPEGSGVCRARPTFPRSHSQLRAAAASRGPAAALTRPMVTPEPETWHHGEPQRCASAQCTRDETAPRTTPRTAPRTAPRTTLRMTPRTVLQWPEARMPWPSEPTIVLLILKREGSSGAS